MNYASTTPFIAILILGIAVFSANPSPTQRTDLSQWKSNQQILLLIENCQDGQIGMGECVSKIPPILDQCKSFHVLACDDQRLLILLNSEHTKIGID